MRVMVIVKATAESEQESIPLDMQKYGAMFEAMGKFNDELVKAGVMLSGDGLKPSRFGKRVHFDGPSRSVTDGPFAETKEQLAGYFLIEVQDRNEAVRIAKLIPGARIGTVEVRPLREVTGLPGEEERP